MIKGYAEKFTIKEKMDLLPDGPWKNEPIEEHKETYKDYELTFSRNHHLGVWRGYIKVSKEESDLISKKEELFGIHGGITWHDKKLPGDQESLDDSWFVGFDCGHYGDHLLFNYSFNLTLIQKKCNDPAITEHIERIKSLHKKYEHQENALWTNYKTLEFCVNEAKLFVEQLLCFKEIEKTEASKIKFEEIIDLLPEGPWKTEPIQSHEEAYRDINLIFQRDELFGVWAAYAQVREEYLNIFLDNEHDIYTEKPITLISSSIPGQNKADGFHCLGFICASDNDKKLYGSPDSILVEEIIKNFCQQKNISTSEQTLDSIIGEQKNKSKNYKTLEYCIDAAKSFVDELIDIKEENDEQ